MRLLIVRHGETIWNAEGRLQGATDIPLSARGHIQAARLAVRLQDEPITAIYASDLQRAYATAAAIAERHDLSVRSDPRLREQAKGQWEGMTFAEIEAQAPEALRRWQADPGNPPGEGGESLRAVVERIGAALADVRAAATDQDSVLIVAHGMVLRTLICLALGLDPVVGWQLTLGNTSISELLLTSAEARLIRLNDTCHLRDGMEG